MSLSTCLRTNLLIILTMVGVICGMIAGILMRMRPEPWTQREIMYVNFTGDLFLRMLKGLIIPLIISSLVSAIGSLNLSASGKIGGRAITYYMITTIMAVILGIILVLVIRPGVGSLNSLDAAGTSKTNVRNTTTTDTLLDLVRNLFPPNIVQACLAQYQTVLLLPSDNSPYQDNLSMWKITNDYADGMNLLGLVVVSLVLGIAISAMNNTTETVLKFFDELSRLMMKITGWVIWFSPIGVFFLITAKLLEMDSLIEVIEKLGLYFVTVTGGILFHGFIVLPTIYFIFTRQNPYKFLVGVGRAMATAIGTSSSSATLPVTIQCLEDNNHIDTRVARFVLPIGATINMDGTALYEAVAAIFIAQLRGVSLSFGNVVAISITATAASIGAAGIPQAGLVTLVMVLDTVGLPAEDVSLIIAVDWLLDRFRTVINVLGDAFGAGIVAHLSKKELDDSDHAKTLNNIANPYGSERI